MRRLFLSVAALIVLGASVASALIWNARRALPYNTEGRYFDSGTAVVFHQQSVAVYAILAVALGLVSVGLVLAARRP